MPELGLSVEFLRRIKDLKYSFFMSYGDKGGDNIKRHNDKDDLSTKRRGFPHKMATFPRIYVTFSSCAQFGGQAVCL